MRWQVDEVTTLLEEIPFSVERVMLRDQASQDALPYFRLRCLDWVNVLPVTPHGSAVLIKQERAGSLTEVLETPGGCMDPGEKDPTLAVARELEEETGLTSSQIISMGALNPNPAIMTNKTHFFVALNCVLNPDRAHFPDAQERIEVQEVPVEELEQLVRFGRVDHCLSALCVMLGLKYLKKE